MSLAISEGKMFHTITYGKGLMGSHSSQLTQEERWKLVHYIRTAFMEENYSSVPEVNVKTEEVVAEKVTEH